MTRAKADVCAIRWLLARHPEMAQDEAEWLVMRSHVIEDSPVLTDNEVDQEVIRRMDESEEGQATWVTSESR